MRLLSLSVFFLSPKSLLQTSFTEALSKLMFPPHCLGDGEEGLLLHARARNTHVGLSPILILHPNFSRGNFSRKDEVAPPHVQNRCPSTPTPMSYSAQHIKWKGTGILQLFSLFRQYPKNRSGCSYYH